MVMEAVVSTEVAMLDTTIVTGNPTPALPTTDLQRYLGVCCSGLEKPWASPIPSLFIAQQRRRNLQSNALLGWASFPIVAREHPCSHCQLLTPSATTDAQQSLSKAERSHQYNRCGYQSLILGMPFFCIMKPDIDMAAELSSHPP